MTITVCSKNDANPYIRVTIVKFNKAKRTSNNLIISLYECLCKFIMQHVFVLITNIWFVLTDVFIFCYLIVKYSY